MDTRFTEIKLWASDGFAVNPCGASGMLLQSLVQLREMSAEKFLTILITRLFFNNTNFFFYSFTVYSKIQQLKCL